jgi:amino acid permease
MGSLLGVSESAFAEFSFFYTKRSSFDLYIQTYQELADGEIAVGFSMMKKYWPALLLLAGVYITAIGLSAMRYSRWDHARNASIHPVFHPWAILVESTCPVTRLIRS